jgi:hypothetical protein
MGPHDHQNLSRNRPILLKTLQSKISISFCLLIIIDWKDEKKGNYRYIPPISRAKRDIWIGFEFPSVSISLRQSIKVVRLPFISLSIFISDEWIELLWVFVVSFLGFWNGFFEPKELPDSYYIERTWPRIIEVVWFLCRSDNTLKRGIILILFLPIMLDFPLSADEMMVQWIHVTTNNRGRLPA